MRQLFRAFILALVSFGLVAGPAMARDYGRYNRRHHDGPNAGAVILGVAGLAVIASIASASAKARREREQRTVGYPPYPPEPVAYPRDDYPATRDDYPAPRNDDPRDDNYGGARINDREAAVNACAYAAENEADSRGDRAEVSDIEDVVRDGERFRVRGEVEVRRGDRSASRYTDKVRFSCVAEDGRVTAFRFDEGGSYAYRR